MATHSSILAWRIPCTEEPGRLLFMVFDMPECTFTTGTRIDFLPNISVFYHLMKMRLF